MTYKHNSLVAREGWLYIVDAQAQFSEPVRSVLFYPTGLRAYDWTEGRGLPLPAPVTPVGTYGGLYEYRPGLGSQGFGLQIRLSEGGNTLPAFGENEPIPCPKVKKGTETRYRHGEWQKYLRSAGWVTA